MIRCPSCGKRLRDAAPNCATHGPPPPAPPAHGGDDAPTPFVVPNPDLPAFRVKKLLGQGGFGAVFLAERVSDGTPVAIKVARADNASASEALVREGAALQAVGVPHVPAVYDSGRLPDGSVYVVMDFVKAPILADVMTELDGPMPLEDFAKTTVAILNVMEVAHDKKLVHCDLKPENVFVHDSFGAKLFDFGLVRDVSAKPAESTKEEGPAGTPEYMSPEQCEGRVDIDTRSDLYALGVIFYEMFSGTPPFFGKAADIQMSHRSRRPPALGRRVPIAVPLEDAIMRCLAKDPERRPATAGELRRMIQAGLVAERARREQAVGAPAEVVPAASGPVAAVAPAAAAKPAAPARERRAVALLFFESKSPVAAVREAITGVGAQLANAAGAQYVLAFGHELGDNPTRAAANAGEMFVGRGLCAKALVDLAQVSIQARPDGTRRYQSPLFTKKEQYPGEADPAGVILSPAAVEVLPDANTEPVASRPGAMLLKKAAQASEKTTTRMGVAPLVGRDDVLRALLETMRASTGATAPRPTITTLIGDAGYGKTHLAQMLVQHLEVLPKVQTIFIRAKEVLGGGQGQTAREILTRALALPEAAPADFGRALLTEAMGPDMARDCWAGVAVAMGWAPPEHPEIKAQAAAPGALRAGAARGAGEALRIMSRKKPLVVIVEDAHFVDETALDALEFATLKEAACPMWICVVGRPNFGQGRTAWAGRAAHRHEMKLGALEPAAASELARRLLSPAENVPASALARLAERTQGIPLFLVELVRGLKRDGLVRKSEKTNAWFLATDELDKLPDLPLVQWLASRETESLPTDLLAHARLASVLGVEFSTEEVEGVMLELERVGAAIETQLDASIGVRRLAESGILVRHRGGRVGFRHSLLRDSVYSGVVAAQREAIHRAAYDHFKRQDRLADSARLPQMAFHAARSGLKVEAGLLYLDLAARTRARHAYLDAESLYKNALENLPAEDDNAQITASRGRGLMRFRLGRHEDAMKDYALALERATKIGSLVAQMDILLDEGIALDWLNEYKASAAAVSRAEELSKTEPATPAIRARILMGLGRSEYRADRMAEAAPLLAECVTTAEPLGDEGYEAFSQGMLMHAFVLSNLGRFDEAAAVSDRCVAVTEEKQDALTLCSMLQNRGFLNFMRGNVDQLIVDFRRSIQTSREFGFPMLEALNIKDLGEVYFYLGNSEEAEPCAARAAELYAMILGDSSPRVAYSELAIARVKAYRGDIDGARALVDKINEKQAKIRAESADAQALPLDGQILLDNIGLFLKGAPDAEFDALRERARTLGIQAQDLIELMEFKALSAIRAGRRDDGIRYIEEALADAEKNAQVVMDRLRRQLDRVSTARAAS
ncbi:MAG TPA: protein kinase [Polyangia bacterium]|nr:protein kinase [Polyangia bacterium]